MLFIGLGPIKLDRPESDFNVLLLCACIRLVSCKISPVVKFSFVNICVENIAF